MKKLFYFALFLFCLSCTTQPSAVADSDALAAVADTTLYGVCGAGSAMHTLQLLAANDDTLYIHIDDEDSLSLTLVVGGLHEGDRMAVTAHGDGDMLTGDRIINISSLVGHWHSVAHDFDLTEDGAVVPTQPETDGAWTTWRILNGQLLLDDDVFDITRLTADTLDLENTQGIYSYHRLYTELPPLERDTIEVEVVE